MKSEVYNLIVLDESGSMSGITSATISGCNETLNVIRATQKEFADSQQQFASIYSFQGGNQQLPSRYLIKNALIENVKDITAEDYRPWGSTPLYDAVGETLSDLKALLRDKPMAMVNVTIITDGYENSSTHYTHAKVASMIEQLKEMGWNFNFIGTNIDVNATAASLGIENSLEFKQDEEGTRMMFENEMRSRRRWAKSAKLAFDEYEADCNTCNMSEPERRKSFLDKIKESSKNYFSKED